MIHLGVAAAGLAAVLHTSAVLFQTIKYLGVAYLLWMAWSVLKTTGSLSIQPSQVASVPMLIWRGILLNLLNPKLPLFFVAFLPQFLPTDKAAGLSMMVELGLGFSAMTFLTFVLYAAIAASGRQMILGSESIMTWLRRAFAVSFAALGARLALERA